MLGREGKAPADDANLTQEERPHIVILYEEEEEGRDFFVPLSLSSLFSRRKEICRFHTHMYMDGSPSVPISFSLGKCIARCVYVLEDLHSHASLIVSKGEIRLRHRA